MLMQHLLVPPEGCHLCVIVLYVQAAVVILGGGIFLFVIYVTHVKVTFASTKNGFILNLHIVYIVHISLEINYLMIKRK